MKFVWVCCPRSRGPGREGRIKLGTWGGGWVRLYWRGKIPACSLSGEPKPTRHYQINAKNGIKNLRFQLTAPGLFLTALIRPAHSDNSCSHSLSRSGVFRHESSGVFRHETDRQTHTHTHTHTHTPAQRYENIKLHGISQDFDRCPSSTHKNTL